MRCYKTLNSSDQELRPQLGDFSVGTTLPSSVRKIERTGFENHETRFRLRTNQTERTLKGRRTMGCMLWLNKHRQSYFY